MDPFVVVELMVKKYLGPIFSFFLAINSWLSSAGHTFDRSVSIFVVFLILLLLIHIIYKKKKWKSHLGQNSNYTQP